MKKLIALMLALIVLPFALCGCATLQNEPNGTRPDTLDGEKLLPDFASRSAIGSEMKYRISLIQSAQDMAAQRDAYQSFLQAGFVYVMGDYNIASFIADDGGNLALYQEEMMNLLNDFLVTYDQEAWLSVRNAQWGAELSQEFSAGASTPDKIRNSYPTTTDDGQELTQAIYDTRQALYTGVQDAVPEEELASLLQNALNIRRDISKQTGYEDYLSFCFQKRDSVPYTPADVLKLAQLVRDTLCPVLERAAVPEAPAALTAAEWMQTAIPALIDRFPAYRDDLLYCLEHNLLTVRDVEENGSPKCFSYMLYQYDASIGRARIAGEFQDLLLITKLLGSMSRDMAIPKQEWAVSSAQLSGAVQSSAFGQLCANELDAVYGDGAASAKRAYDRLQLENICRSAMVYELLYRLYTADSVTADSIAALAEELSQSYNLPLSAMDIYSMNEIQMGTSAAAQALLGSLAGVQIGILNDSDPSLAEEFYTVMLGVYNYASPVNEAVRAGMANPYSADSIAAAADWYASRLQA